MKPITITAPHLITLVFLTAFSTLSLNMFLPSLANIASDLNVGYALVSLAVAGYLAITAVIQLIVGPLSDRLGRRPVILAGLIIFTLASLICATAQDVWAFLIFRMFQGAIISGYAISLAIVRDTNNEQDAASLIGYISMAMALAPMLGPVLGGALDTLFGWRSNFYFYALSGLILLIVCWFDLGETHQPQKPEDARHTASPLVLFKEPLFWAYSLCGAFSVGAFYIFLTGSPLVASQQFGVTTAELGIYIGSITAGFMLGGYIAGKLATRYQPTTMMIAGRLVACLGLLAGILIIWSGSVSILAVFGCTIFVGLGNGITLPSCSSGAMSIQPGFAGSAAGFSGALMVAVGAILTTLTGQLLPEENPALLLLTLMLTTSMFGLLCAVWAIHLRGRN